MRVFPEREIAANIFKNESEREEAKKAIACAAKTAPLDDWTTFAKATKLKAALLKKIRPLITQKDATAQPVMGEADADLRDTENIPFTYDGGIDGFIEREVHPYAPDAWVDEKKTQIGYEVSFTKYFYKPVELRDIKEILDNLASLENEARNIIDDVIGGPDNESL